jgi:hypothetical protein
VFECGDASAARVAPAPQIVDFHWDFERNRVAHFLWFLSFGKTKERNSPSGEIFARRPHRKGENDYWNKAILAGQMSAGAEKAARQGKKPNLRQASDEQLITPA